MQIRTNIRPGDIGHIIHLHGTFYAEEHNLDHTFEGYVASGMGEFAKAFDERKDRLWLAEDGGRIVGSIAIAGHTDRTAQLRWFLVAPQARGCGLGSRLLRAALDFCREREFGFVFLWTLSDLKAAAHLYQRAGFSRTEQKTREIWGGTRTEERYDLILQTSNATR
jgi:ribosomal protein S18 acetylase RimI-like enzyme